MKKVTRFISLLLTTLILITFLNFQSHATDTKFNDVKTSDWFHLGVTILTQQGLIDGYPDGSFGPGQTITVGEFLTIVVRSYDR
ncbi:S-layer homology domain-containing protein [Petrocella sp. FN5]|uniref:S-layer homology domain-containing protein n=1 Tax=Petrocella sp. FN5 TaxID=3032002 RepID=UPI0023DB88A1|nr:S-layer homology domain-containing protein [Petrocella sp. FN5]MDF1617299.1 S-layer homology domain-containing protein [Petrocella sp. FN5]